jgi:hypothetical protein
MWMGKSICNLMDAYEQEVVNILHLMYIQDSPLSVHFNTLPQTIHV